MSGRCVALSETEQGYLLLKPRYGDDRRLKVDCDHAYEGLLYHLKILGLLKLLDSGVGEIVLLWCDDTLVGLQDQPPGHVIQCYNVDGGAELLLLSPHSL